MREAVHPDHVAGNQLEYAASSYLRSARFQPIHWQQWGPAAFERAQNEDKPILLDIGAVWCHWCHVMDRESYEDPAIAAIVNEHFIPIKVDRDERPDVDARYQAAVSAITGQSGWPLTAFLAPDGRPYFGGTYIPRNDSYGRAGIAHVLRAMAQVWREKREEALETAAGVMTAIEHNETLSSPGRCSPQLIEQMLRGILALFDPRNGGFGAQPKFPHPPALDLLLHAANTGNNELARDAFVTTLEKMASGGIYDQIAGGFHRYSVDAYWGVPHFEKLLPDNAGLLRNYVHGFQSLAREEFREIATETIGWLDATMTDRKRGGFYASLDADVGLDDDGDYFTWTLDEIGSVLNPAELEFATKYWGVGQQGDMPHNPAKNVLRVRLTLAEMAAQSGVGESTLHALRNSVRQKLLAARTARPAPFIDRTLYTGWNAMAVTAYFEAARVLHLDSAREFALLTINRLLNEAWPGGKLLCHVIAYPDGSAPAEKIAGTLDDYAFTIHACLDAWLATGRMNFYYVATMLADSMIERFFDRDKGGFFDTAQNGEPVLLGVLAARRKPLQDSPAPAGNPTAASALLRLNALGGQNKYREFAEQTLTCFAGLAEQLGLYAGSYGLAAGQLLLDPVQVVVVGSGPEAGQLEAAALRLYAVNKTVIRIDPSRLVPGGVPEALEEILLQVAGLRSWAQVCRGHTCIPPITDPEALARELQPPS